MRRSLRLLAGAEEDLAEAFEWYDSERPEVALLFMAEIAECLVKIQDRPWLYPVVYRGVRRAVVHDSPYCVFYLVGDETITVVSIHHGSRDPKHWKRQV